VREAGRGEVRGEGPVDPLAEPDENPCRKPGGRFGQSQLQRIACRGPDALHEPVRIGVGGDRAERARGERRGHAGPREVRAVGVVRRRPPAVSIRPTKRCVPSRGAPRDTTRTIHGPSPAGSATGPAAAAAVPPPTATRASMTSWGHNRCTGRCGETSPAGLPAAYRERSRGRPAGHGRRAGCFRRGPAPTPPSASRPTSDATSRRRCRGR